MRLSTRRVAIGGIAIAVIAVAAFSGVYLTLFNPKSVAAVALPKASPIVIATPGAGAATPALAAQWTVASGSFVGYRVREQLASLPAPSDAVGRTKAVTGTAAVSSNADGSVTVSAVSVEADLSQLTSDSGRRDNYLQQNALQTGSYPTATFVTTAAFTCPATVVSGGAGTATAHGKFTIHGQARDVSIPIQVQRSGTSVNVVATYSFSWGDYGVQAPQVPVASVKGNPTIEISLTLTSA